MDLIEQDEHIVAREASMHWPHPWVNAIAWVAGAASMRGTLIYDTRGVVDVDAARRAGLRVERLGRPGAGQPGAGVAAAASSVASDA